jgi:hypothetical protein
MYHELAGILLPCGKDKGYSDMTGRITATHVVA